MFFLRFLMGNYLNFSYIKSFFLFLKESDEYITDFEKIHAYDYLFVRIK